MHNPLRALFERRSIGSPYELLQYYLRGAQSTAGANVNEVTAMNVMAVRTCVSLRSRMLATLPVGVYERVDGRSRREAPPTHPVQRVLLKPNTWQTRSDLFGMLEAHRVLRGNAYAWKNISKITNAAGEENDQVLELVPMHPDQVEVLDQQDDFGGLTKYKFHRRNGGQPIDMTSREVVHLRALSTDGRRGRPVLQDLKEVIGGAIALQEHANTLWARDATPSVALSHPSKLSDKARKNLEDSWEATYGHGKDKKRVAVIEEGMKIEQLSLKPNEGQFLETAQDLRAQIAAVMHVPPHLAGLSDKVTSWGTGIEQQQIGFFVITMTPDLVMWEERLNVDLIARPEKYYVKFNAAGLLRADLRSQFEAFWRGIQMGVYSPNDVRALLDMNPIEGGDIYLQPVNMVPLGFEPSSARLSSESGAQE